MPEPQLGVQINVPPEEEGGTYSNFLSVWHTGHEFTFDFCATQPVQETEEGPVLGCRVVSRVRVPPTLVFDILRALNDNMTKYEDVYGEIKRLEPQVDNDQEETSE